MDNNEEFSCRVCGRRLIDMILAVKEQVVRCVCRRELPVRRIQINGAADAFELVREDNPLARL